MIWSQKKVVCFYLAHNRQKFSEMDINEILNLLKSAKNIVLTGALGTGKTFLAQRLATKMVLGEDKEYHNLTEGEKEILNKRMELAQFHPSYDYTDFVEGLRPKTENSEIPVGGINLVRT